MHRRPRWQPYSRQGPKVRWARAGSGKRGGLRVIDYWAPDENAVFMLYAYSKNDQADLTSAQARRLGRIVREEFK
ncbi:MAG: hypothetical protein FJW23_16270 [Acidimicrobiia bacterium]|nr:hypothetical protein [Acidimicrobiia bacterium]